jgi:hypothetical protein
MPKKKPKDQQWIKKKPTEWLKKKGPEVPEIELYERGGRGLGAAASPAKKDKEGIIIVVGDGKSGSKEMRIQKKGGGIAQRGLGRAFKKGGRA